MSFPPRPVVSAVISITLSPWTGNFFFHSKWTMFTFLYLRGGGEKIDLFSHHVPCPWSGVRKPRIYPLNFESRSTGKFEWGRKQCRIMTLLLLLMKIEKSWVHAPDSLPRTWFGPWHDRMPFRVGCGLKEHDVWKNAITCVVHGTTDRGPGRFAGPVVFQGGVCLRCVKIMWPNLSAVEHVKRAKRYGEMSRVLALFVWPVSIDWPERKCEKNIFTHRT